MSLFDSLSSGDKLSVEMILSGAIYDIKSKRSNETLECSMGSQVYTIPMVHMARIQAPTKFNLGID